MFIVYVLYSSKSDSFYVGMTNNLSRRLKEHNNGKNISTRKGKSWVVVHTESFETRISARQREKYLKTAAGKKWRNLNIRPRGATE